MTKKLEDLLNLPDSKQIVEESRKEKKETALAEISSISESLAIEMLESLSVGEIDKGKIAALSKTDN